MKLLMKYLFKSYKNTWTRAFDFRGRTSRREYWWAYLAYFICYLLTSYIHVSVMYSYSLIFFIPYCSLTIRRLRDVGKSWQWIFINFIPIAGSIWFLIILCRPSRAISQRRDPSTSALQRESKGFDDIPQQLEKLKGMLDEGVISDEEYEAMRKKTLGL